MTVLRLFLIVGSVLLFGLLLLAIDRFCRPGAPIAHWLGRRLCGVLLWLLRVHVEAPRDDDTLRSPRLVVANHISWLDVLVLQSTESLCFLAKREVAGWPVISALARLQGTIFVDRRRRRQIPAVNVAMAERMRAGRSVLLFPEGTTYDGSRRGTFFTSHLACLRTRFEREPDLTFCQVQAVGLAYSDPIAAWIGDMSLVPHVWAVLNHPAIACRVTCGPTVRIERGYDRKRLGRMLKESIDALVANPETPTRA